MRRARFLVLLTVALIAAGCARQAPSPMAAAPMAAAAQSDLDTLAYGGRPVAYAAAPRETTYLLDSGDRLRVVVYGQDGLTNSYSVDASGNITMPLIGSVKARGHSTAQLSGAIAAKLRQGYMREPYVAVEVEAYRPFFILGEVTFPGQYPYVADMTVETAVAIAGGFTPRAERYKVEISRNVRGESLRASVPTGTPVKPGDTIVVAERWF
jgi:polysaccharide biosynthesis/export protein